MNKFLAFFVRLLSEFKEGTPSKKLSIIADILSIIGLSIFVLFSTFIFEGIVKSKIHPGNFLIVLMVLWFCFLFFIAILGLFSQTRSFFLSNMGWYGTFLYYGFHILLWLFALGMFFTLGIEMIQSLVFE